MAFECAHKARVDDTLEMGYYVDDFTDPWKTPDVIVLQTGCNKPRQLFYAWVPGLGSHFRVIRPHLRGHWDSSLPPEGYEWTIEGLVSDLKNFLDALGLDKVHFVGQAMGGLLGYHLAYRYPERLKTFTAVTAPGPGFKHHRIAQTSTLLGPDPGKHTPRGNDLAYLIEEMGTENRALAQWVHNEVKKNNLETTVSFMKAAANCEVDIEEFLPRIKVPTLLMMGSEHRYIITVEEAQHFRGLMPQAKLVTFPGVRAPCEYVVPEKCVQEVLQFIREQGYL